MSNSLRDLLVGLGFEAAPTPPKPERTARAAGPPRPAGATPRHDAGRPRNDAGRPRSDAGRPRNDAGRPRSDAGKPRQDAGAPRQDVRKPQESGDRRNAGGPRKTREEMDLGKAYALRAQTEKHERIAAEAAKQEEARLRREARARLTEFLKGLVLNDPAAEIARHFPYGGKIKRIHVTAAQLQALNRGELGVLQQDGRYLLVDKATLDAAEAIFAPALALRVDPDAPAGDDPYADPAYQVPDDLVW
jgi:uncharacterized protein YaiL (DUF2058 family)